MLSVRRAHLIDSIPTSLITHGLTIGSLWRGKIVLDRCPGSSDGRAPLERGRRPAKSRRLKMGTITASSSLKVVGTHLSSVEAIMKCPPALLAVTFLLRVAIFYWKFICLIEDAIPSWEHLASLGKTWATLFEGGAWRNWRLPIGVAHRARIYILDNSARFIPPHRG